MAHLSKHSTELVKLPMAGYSRYERSSSTDQLFLFELLAISLTCNPLQDIHTRACEILANMITEEEANSFLSSFKLKGTER